MNHKIYLKVNTDLAADAQILSWFEQINQPPLADQKTWWECQTLLIEGFTNIVEHAHKNLLIDTPIEIEAVRSDKQIEIRIWSVGQPFDLQQQLHVTAKFEENEQYRGRGLQIMSAIADKFSYELLADHRLCLCISKSY